MEVRNMKQRSVRTHDFSMNPRAPVQRSSFPVRQGHKTTFSASFLVPIYLEEVMPGDMFNISVSAVARTAVPITPIMDNWVMEFFFFYQPNRVSWTNWEKLMGAQTNPGDSIAFTVPTCTSPNSGYAPNSVFDYLGLPTVGQVTGGVNVTHNVLPLRMYNRVYNSWFRDQNLQSSQIENVGNGPDGPGDYGLQIRGKRFDYFTAALPFVQKGSAVLIPLGTSATIRTSPTDLLAGSNPAGTTIGVNWRFSNGGAAPGTIGNYAFNSAARGDFGGATGQTASGGPLYPVNLYADLTTAASASVNTFRTAIATQQLLERDARGGTRYVETIFAHWGVRPPDYRLDRPEYIGGGRVPVLINAIPQTSATGLTGGTTPAGNLAATGFAQGRAGFSYAATEHGYIMGLACVTADLTYSQGMRRHWNRSTRYDFPYPEFAHLGEQAILNKEIYAVGSATGGLGAADQDMQVFGYIPRYDECRHFPSMITGMFKPTTTNNIAYWHSSQQFSALPVLNSSFITDDARTVLRRNFAAGSLADNQQFIADFLFTGKVARPLPVNAVPGLNRF